MGHTNATLAPFFLHRFDVAEHFDTVPELADRAFNRPRKATLETAQVRVREKKTN